MLMNKKINSLTYVGYSLLGCCRNISDFDESRCGEFFHSTIFDTIKKFATPAFIKVTDVYIGFPFQRNLKNLDPSTEIVLHF